MIKYQDEVTSREGNVVPGAIITVYLAGTSTPAILYANSAGSAPLANPVTANYTGYFYFYAASGTYDLVITGTGITQIIYTDVTLGGSGVPGQFTVDGATYKTIQAAITAAGTTGSVTIPSNYAGTDTYANPSKIQILDLRGKPNRQRGFINALVDCGLKGDGVTDDGPAIQACFDAYPSAGFIFPQTVSNNCSYFSGQTLYPKGSGVQIIGGSGSQYLDNVTPGHMGGTEICFASGVTGLWLDIDNPHTAQGGAIRNITLRGKNTFLSLTTPTGINLSGTLPQYTRSIASIQRASNVLTVQVTPTNGAGSEALFQQVGSTVKISGVVGDATMNGNCVISALSGYDSVGGNPSTFTCAQNGSDAGPFASDGQTLLPSTGASTADGIRVCSNFWTIDHVGVVAFERHGINADSVAGHGCSLPFSDDLIIHDSMLMENGGSGYYGQGADNNAGVMSGNSFYYNFLYGIEDQSSLGNTWVGSNISNNGHLWASSTQPTTKAISSISRTLTSGSSQVSVVLSVADTNLKLGSCVVIAGVTDISFNTSVVNPGGCFFINSFTDSTHFGYEQPGAPANASSSGGTSRMAKFSEVYLASGVDDGAMKIGTQAGFSPTLLNQYVEGGQGCKFNGNTIAINGANQPPCTGGGTWTGQFITTQGCTGLGGHLCLSAPSFVYNKELTGETIVKAGITTDKPYWLTWYNHSNLRSWILIGDPAGTLGGSGSWQLQSGTGQSRLIFWGKDVNTGHTYLNAEGSGAKVIIGKNFAGTNAGTGGLEIQSGGASPAVVGAIDGTGLISGIAFKSTTTNPASAGQVRLAKTDVVNVRNNANNADVTLLSLDGSDNLVLPTVASLTSTGTVSAGALSVGGDSISVTPREAWGAFLPGVLTSTWTGAQFTPKKGIIVVQIEVAAKTAPVTCSPNAVIRLTDGSTNLDTTLNATTVTNNIAGGQVYAANSVLQVKVSTAAAGCGTSPADVNVTIQYKMAA